jgi:hypothetical protein
MVFQVEELDHHMFRRMPEQSLESPRGKVKLTVEEYRKLRTC